MGKNKGGGFNLFESYVASGLADIQSNNKNTDMSYVPLPESMRTSTLLEQIGKDRQWSEDQINNDIEIMENNRLYYVRDLRELSKNSWKKIELLPIVKDLLKKSLYPETTADVKPNKKDKKMKKKQEKKKKKMMQLGTPVSDDTEVISQDPETIRNTLSNLSIGPFDPPINPDVTNERKKSVSFSDEEPLTITNNHQNNNSSSGSSSSSSSSSSSESDMDEKVVSTYKTMTEDNKKVFTGRPIQAISGNRIRVRTNDGDVFEADRYCPHKKVDLVSWGQVVGRSVICTKHNWNLSLDGGFTKKGKSINACKVNDW